MTAAWPVGMHVLVSELGEDPVDAVEHHVELAPQPAPDPGTLRSTDATVAVESASVGWVDLLMTSGQYQHETTLPYTPGLEYSGVVIWVGADVDPDALALGDRVMADGALTGPRSKGDYRRNGGFASYAVAPAVARPRGVVVAAMVRVGALGQERTSPMQAARCVHHCPSWWSWPSWP